jgi:L-cystine uptake protein TcyP (sodium:dicarboxylate symporter family)
VDVPVNAEFEGGFAAAVIDRKQPDGARVLNAETRMRLLVVLLRIAGLFTMTAFLAMLLPVEWMTSTHRWLGLGELPRAPVVDYLARSIAGLYGFHGLLLMIVSGDPVRYHTIVWYVAFMNILFGLMLLAIDIHASLPLWWTISEGPPIVLFGFAIALLNRSLPVAPSVSLNPAQGRQG